MEKALVSTLTLKFSFAESDVDESNLFFLLLVTVVQSPMSLPPRSPVFSFLQISHCTTPYLSFVMAYAAIWVDDIVLYHDFIGLLPD